MADSPGGASQLKATTGAGFRYQYLAGGVNTGSGWAGWNPNGSFVTSYVQESGQSGLIPVFSYYMILHSAPGNTLGEPAGVFANLQNVATMTAYYNDLRLFFERAGAFPATLIVLHVEPDLWGYAQQRATGDDPTTVPAKVSATGVPDLAGLPNDVSGLAQAVARLRDKYAPNVVLAYHLSVWGTNVDISWSDPPDATVDGLGGRAAAFFNALGGGFGLVFGEVSDRDSAFKQLVWGQGAAAWWDAEDFRRYARFLAAFVSGAQRRVVMWQIPLGNTRMRAMNNTQHHYQDNRVEWFLDDPGRAHLLAYAGAGVVAFLFGRGVTGATCACDASGDGVTNPAAINGNVGLSLSADDDGGFFRQKALAYYAAEAIGLEDGGPGPGDTTDPTTAITAGPTGTVSSPDASLAWTGSDDVTPAGGLLYAFRLAPLEAAFSAFGAATTASYADLLAGTYTFHVKARDAAGNEDSTPATRSFTVASRPDLVATAVSNPTGAAAAGARFTVTDSVRNQGAASRRTSRTRYYLSAGAVRGTGDRRLAGSRVVPGLDAGAVSAGSAVVTVPWATVPGTYRLLACADDGKAVVEADEGNNCVASTGSITVHP